MANTDNSPYIFPADIPTVIASGAISARRFVKVATGGVGNRPKVAQCAANTDHVLGVAMVDAATGASLGIWRAGIVPVEVPGAITAGTLVWPDANGMAATGGTGRAWGVVVADVAAAGSAPVALSIG